MLQGIREWDHALRGCSAALTQTRNVQQTISAWDREAECC